MCVTRIVARAVWQFILVVGVVEADGVGVGRSGASHARCEDEFRGLVVAALCEEHVAAGAVEEGREDFVG